MAARRDAVKHPAFRGRSPSPSSGNCLCRMVSGRQQKAGEAEGERRLADAARSAQQNCVWHPAGFEEPPQLALGVLVTDEVRVRPRRQNRGRSIRSLPYATCHLGAAAGRHADVSRQHQYRRWIVCGSLDPSISTQRVVSSAAIFRKPCVTVRGKLCRGVQIGRRHSLAPPPERDRSRPADQG